jgi:hypothetical protein
VNLSIAVTSVMALRRRRKKQPAMTSSAPPLVADYDDGFLNDYGGAR